MSTQKIQYQILVGLAILFVFFGAVFILGTRHAYAGNGSEAQYSESYFDCL